MLRGFVLLLLLANAAYFAWSQGLLRAYGFAPLQVSEPHRVTQQIRPEALQVLTPDEARRMEATASASARPAECLQAGLFDEVQASVLRQALEGAWPAGAWVLEPAIQPARWMLYTGKFATAEALTKKRGELAALGIRAESVADVNLAPGLSLGLFESRAAADAELVTMNKRGVRTARVLQERAEVRGSLLRLPVVDDALRAQVDSLKPLLADRPLRSCR